MSTEIQATCGEWDCSPEDYHARIDHYGSSMLSDFRHNPAYFHGRYIAGTIPPDEPSRAMRIGTLLHLLVLQPHVKVISPPKFDRRTKDGKANHEAFMAQMPPGVVVADQDELAIAKACAMSILCHDEASQLIALEGECEHPIWWIDEETGLRLKSLRDKATAGILIDLKTAADASPEAFARSMYSYRYFAQAAHYLDGHEALTGERAQFLFVAVETAPPYTVAIFELDDDALRLGREQNRITMNKLARCLESGDWLPEFSKGVNRISLPRYAAYQEYEV